MNILRSLVAIALCSTLIACKTLPVDPNLPELTRSAEQQQQLISLRENARAQAYAEAVKACASATSEAIAKACMDGIEKQQLVIALGEARGSGGGGQVSLPNYQRPPTLGEQIAAVGSGWSSTFNAVAGAWSNTRIATENNKTTRTLATINANRELGTVQAISHLGETIATTDAARPPSIQIGAGGVYATGDVTQVAGDLQNGDRTSISAGRDITGGDHSEDSHNVTTCNAGSGGAVVPTPTAPSTGTGTTPPTTPTAIANPGGDCSQIVTPFRFP